MTVKKNQTKTNHHPTGNTAFTYAYKPRLLKLLNYTTNFLDVYQPQELLLAYKPTHAHLKLCSQAESLQELEKLRTYMELLTNTMTH